MEFIDNKKFLEDFYPNLHWEKSYNGIVGLIDVENKCVIYFNEKYKRYVKIWEYGYYYLSLLLQNIKLHISYSVIIALYAEALTSIRCSFLSNMNGYHPDSISVLRRVHECCIKAMAGRAFPQKIWDIVQDSSLQKAESDLGINLKWIYRIEGSYLHSNKLKIIGIGKKLKVDSSIGIPFGPQLNDKEFLTSANISIFWIYVLILIATRLFTDQIPDHWLNKYKDSCNLFRDYMEQISGNKLIQSAKDIEKILVRIGP